MHQDLLGRPEGRPEREEERPGDGVHPLLDLRRHSPDNLYRPDSLLVSLLVSLHRPDSLLVSRLYSLLHLRPLE
jgi:hypothetical protein